MLDSTTEFDRWILRPAPRDDAALRLVCAPYAGGSAAAFHGWADRLPEGVDVWLLRLPGRDARLHDPPSTDLAELVPAITAAIAGGLTEPFALFGHSLGASIAFELTGELVREHGLRAAQLSVSARCAPHIHTSHEGLHELPADEFMEALERRFQAIPPAIKEDRELRDLYLPILRADAQLLETYRPTLGAPLDCPITAYGGREDPEVSKQQLAEWSQHTNAGFSMTMFPGGHFYLQSERDHLLRLISRDLVRCLVP